MVAVDRATLPSSVTFRLSAQPLFFESDGTATVEVAAVSSSTDVSTPPPSAEVDQPTPVGVFEAPAAGGVASVQLDDGFPIWLVHHDDGSVSAIPGIVDAASTPLYPAEDTIDVVAWLEGARRFAGRALHDEWGRALTDGRYEDLVGYVATLADGRVHVARRDSTRLPGAPFFDGARDFTSFVRPTLRPASTARLETGWWQLEANVITADGESRLCANLDPSPCPPDSPLVPTLVDVDAGITLWRQGPVIVHVRADGSIDEVGILGGSSNAADAN